MRKYKKHKYPGVRPGKRPGTWIIDYVDHADKRHQVTYRGTEKDASRQREHLLVQKEQIRTGMAPVPEGKSNVLSLHQLWNMFETDRQLKIDAGSMSDRTLERCRNSYQALVNFDRSLAPQKIKAITPDVFEQFKVYRRKLGMKSEGINVDLRKLKTLFNFAVKKGLLKVSPLLEISRIQVPKADVRFLTEEELNSLQIAVEAIDPDDEFQRDARDLTMFLLFTGARRGEVLYPTLDWSCVSQSAIRFPRTKMSKSRTIPMTDSVREILDRRRSQPGGPFRLDGGRVYSRVKWLLKTAGIEDASPHTLRKTAGAWYYMATKDIFATSKFLGHSTVIVTQDHYAGLIQSLQVEYAERFENTLRSRLQLGCN